MKNCNSYTKLVMSIIVMLLFSLNLNAQSITAAGYGFTASSTTYNYLSNGTAVHAVEVDDAYTTIPIGFTFRFCGANYTNVTVCSNGWLRFGTGPGTAVANWNYNASSNSGIEPAVYALYEDVSGAAGTSSYVVTGTAPNRIFKWECRDWLWDYAAAAPSVSFQVWLYETTGKIECIYKSEDPSYLSVGTSGGATIGIGNSSTDWQVLSDVSANPTSSSTTYVANLSASPATGQSYAWDPGPICNAPTALSITNVNSKSVDFTWNGPTSAVGYEYVVDNSSGGPAGTSTPSTTNNTAASELGLTPSTQYYIHVRTKCGATNFSPWVTLPFKTLEPCVITKNPGIQFPRVDSNSADITWPAAVNTSLYEYVLKLDRALPTSGTSTSTTVNTQFNATNLTSGQTYYFFLRVICTGNDTSDWFLDSFYVPVPCRTPYVQFNDINTNHAIAYWNKITTAYEYDLIISETQIGTPTGNGIQVKNNSYLLPYLNDNTQYFVYVRAACDDRGVKGFSDWYETSFTTWALGVENVSRDDQLINIYPNPVGSELHLSLNNAINSGKLSIVDITGKVMITKNIEQSTSTINVSTLPQGIYLLQFSNETHTQHVKFIKQ